MSVRRNQQALSLTLSGHKFERVLVGADDAQSYVDQLRALGVSCTLRRPDASCPEAA